MVCKKYFSFCVIFSLCLITQLFSDLEYDNHDGIYSNEGAYVRNTEFVTGLDEDFYLINLGPHCDSTHVLNELGLRKSSYPYDWCVVPFNGLYKSLKNSFSGYVDACSLYIKDKDGPFNIYGINLPHDFPKITKTGRNKKKTLIVNPEWRTYIERVQEKYKRRFIRFNIACNSKKKVYFFRFGQIEKHEAAQLSELISFLYPDLDFLLICISGNKANYKDWRIPKVKNWYSVGGTRVANILECRRLFESLGIPTKLRKL